MLKKNLAYRSAVIVSLLALSGPVMARGNRPANEPENIAPATPQPTPDYSAGISTGTYQGPGSTEGNAATPSHQ